MRLIATAIASVFALLTMSGQLLAQSDPENGYFENEGICETCEGQPHFNWTFQYEDGWGGTYFTHYVSYGTAGAFAWFGNTWVNDGQIQPYFESNQWAPAFDNQGFQTDEYSGSADWDVVQPMSFVRRTFVPAAGGNFIRYMDTWTNTGDDDLTVRIVFTGNAAAGDGQMVNIIETSDGDDRVGISDTWVVFDDTEGSGIPSSAIVWQSEDADETADAVELDESEWGAYFSLTFEDVTFAPGESKTFGLFAASESSRADAETTASELTDMGDVGSDWLDEVEDTLVNFIPGEPGAPRVRAHGPYRVAEGGSIDLAVEVYDPDDLNTPPSFSWDFNNDGTFGDAPNDLGPTIDCTNVDGPAIVRVGIRMNDGVTTVDRHVAVSVFNEAPVVTSTPPATATTGDLYSYQITTTDFPADVLSYDIDEGPQGMSVSDTGLVTWTPAANGQGPTIHVDLIVTDDDAGANEHGWDIDMQGGPIVIPGGPYRVAEGGEVLLSPEYLDPEDQVLTYGWDLDGDGIFDDGFEPTATWSAAGIDGPDDGFVVRLKVSDGDFEVSARIPVNVQNAAPEFTSQPRTSATVERLWSYELEATDPGADEITFSVDEEDLPLGMEWNADDATLTWTPTAAALVSGSPAGHFEFAVSASDDDRGHTRQDIQITVVDNQAPPPPPIKYPDGIDPVPTAQPTIILDNVDDPDGDEVLYFIEADWDPCFCSPEYQASNGLTEGPLVTQWTLPRPFNIDVANGGHTTFYLRRWASDGLSDSRQELSLFAVDPSAGGGDADSDSDGDSDDEEATAAGCASCRVGASRSSGAGAVVAAVLLFGLIAYRRR